MLIRARRFIGTLAVPAGLLWASLLAFGLLIPWLGLYSDDWPFVYVNDRAGLTGVVQFISWVRPVAAWVFAGFAALGGTHFWIYHVLLLLLRWLDALLFWRLLRSAFPGSPGPALWAALLFAIYPAFKQQPLALEYFPHFVSLGLLFASLWASLRLVNFTNRPDRGAVRAGLFLLAWLGSFQVFIIEYFAGLEVLRPALFWLALTRSDRAGEPPRRVAAVRALLLWLPYLAVMAAFLAWRVLVVRFPSYQPELIDGLRAAPLTALKELALTILRDLWTAGAAAWWQPVEVLSSAPAAGRTGLVSLVLVGAAFLSTAAFLLYARRRDGFAAEMDRPGSRSAPLAFTAFGILAMLAAGWPFWVTRIPLTLDFPWDRTSLAFMVGAALLGAGLLGLLEQGVLWVARRLSVQGWPARAAAALPALPALLAAGLAALSIGLHFHNANLYRKEWSILPGFYWQLAWRAPGLQPGTAIVLDQSPFNYHVDKFLAPLVNWTYDPEATGSESIVSTTGADLTFPTLRTSYTLLDFHKVWGTRLPPKTAADPIETSYGTIAFQGDTSRLLLVVYAPPACLSVLSARDEGRMLMSAELKKALPLSNLQQIVTGPAVPATPPGFLGPEPAHGWCYYFQKASLALQVGDWTGAAALGDEAIAAGFAPALPSEYLVFAEAYARQGRWTEARELSQKTASSDDFYHRAACLTWQYLRGDLDPEEVDRSLEELGCQ